MKVKDVISQADALKPNDYSEKIKVGWLNEVEGKVQTEVFLLAPEEIFTYSSEGDLEAELLVAPPHDKLYAEYLAAKIDYANEDYDSYQNTMAMFNSFWNEFVAWFANTYRPADTHFDYYTDGDGVPMVREDICYE